METRLLMKLPQRWRKYFSDFSMKSSPSGGNNKTEGFPRTPNEISDYYCCGIKAACLWFIEVLDTFCNVIHHCSFLRLLYLDKPVSDRKAKRMYNPIASYTTSIRYARNNAQRKGKIHYRYFQKIQKYFKKQIFTNI